MHRLPVESALLAQDAVSLPSAAAHHLRVLRPKPGERVELFDGLGRQRVYSCGIDASAPLMAAGDVQIFPKVARPVTLFACVTKGSRWDWTVEKATELGVSKIVPVISDRCVVRLSAGERESKAIRWRRIAEDAARQSHAAWLPEIMPAADFRDCIDMVGATECFAGVIADPPPPPLLKALEESRASTGTLGFFVGPEGDFTPAELDALKSVANPVSLGPTVLRAETAAIFGLSVMMGFLEKGTGAAK